MKKEKNVAKGPDPASAEKKKRAKRVMTAAAMDQWTKNIKRLNDAQAHLEQVVFQNEIEIPGGTKLVNDCQSIRLKIDSIREGYEDRMKRFKATEAKRDKLIRKKRAELAALEGEPASDEKPESEQGNSGVS
jgi:hypothetical protein